MQSRYYNPRWGRFLNADGLIGAGGLIGYNMFAYCNNNPVMLCDCTGTCAHNGKTWDCIDCTAGCTPTVKPPVQIDNGPDIVSSNNYTGKDNEYDCITKSFGIICNLVGYITNDDEMVALNAKYIAFYKGKIVIKLPIGTNAASFGIIFLGTDVANRSDAIDTLKHEYGHTKQFMRMGLTKYTAFVAVPSVTCNILDRFNLLPYDYYSSPWEYRADVYGGVNRGGYCSWAGFADFIYSFFTF